MFTNLLVVGVSTGVGVVGGGMVYDKIPKPDGGLPGGANVDRGARVATQAIVAAVTYSVLAGVLK